MKLVPMVAALALSLSASMSMAQEANPTDMMAGMSMLESNVVMAFSKYGITADVNMLTMGELAAIIGILNDTERDSGGNSAKGSIEAIIANN